MRLENIRIKPGEKIRVVVRIKGKKYYLPLKAGKLISYEKSHRQDLLKQHTKND